MKRKSIAGVVTDYIETHLNDDLSLDQVAEYAGYSKFYLNRTFREEVGCTIYKYIQMRRMTEAAGMLVDGDQPIIEIALAAGYQSQQAFTDAFREVYGCSPNAYRQEQVFVPVMPRYQAPKSSSVSTISCMGRAAA